MACFVNMAGPPRPLHTRPSHRPTVLFGYFGNQSIRLLGQAAADACHHLAFSLTQWKRAPVDVCSRDNPTPGLLGINVPSWEGLFPCDREDVSMSMALDASQTSTCTWSNRYHGGCIANARVAQRQAAAGLVVHLELNGVPGAAGLKHLQAERIVGCQC